MLGCRSRRRLSNSICFFLAAWPRPGDLPGAGPDRGRKGWARGRRQTVWPWATPQSRLRLHQQVLMSTRQRHRSAASANFPTAPDPLSWWGLPVAAPACPRHCGKGRRLFAQGSFAGMNSWDQCCGLGPGRRPAHLPRPLGYREKHLASLPWLSQHCLCPGPRVSETRSTLNSQSCQPLASPV